MMRDAVPSSVLQVILVSFCIRSFTTICRVVVKSPRLFVMFSIDTTVMVKTLSIVTENPVPVSSERPGVLSSSSRGRANQVRAEI